MADKTTADEVTKPAAGTQDPGAKDAPISETESAVAEDQITAEGVDQDAEDAVISSETETSEDLVEAKDQEDVSSDVTAPPAAQPEIERIIEKRGGFGAALLGGAVAAVLGFAVGQGGLLNSVLPSGLLGSAGFDKASYEADMAAHAKEQAEIKEQLAALQGQLGGLDLPDLAPLQTRIDELETTVETLRDDPASGSASADEIAALTARLDQIEARPLTDAASPEAVAAFEGELAKLQQSLATQRSEVEDMLTEARLTEQASLESARIASAQLALAKIRISLDAGGSFAAPLAELQGLQVSVPAALSGSGDAGVTPLSGLQASYPALAREALALARQDSAGSGSLMDYVNRHLGARSVTPQDGDGADAVLSRAEAALQSGSIADALAEVETLPAPARAVFADWLASAQTRLAAIAAVDQLAQSLNAK
ncbi:hypothetical protein [Pseudophaeobacter sp.]|uniref:COG4223 family protein n=1 Tax=Pseudophaeobacter sp. TaxID=1971739 RepID=UPI002636781C|nr:hypothetical protein [Pseudophaeobacter sp.]